MRWELISIVGISIVSVIGLGFLFQNYNPYIASPLAYLLAGCLGALALWSVIVVLGWAFTINKSVLMRRAGCLSLFTVTLVSMNRFHILNPHTFVIVLVVFALPEFTFGAPSHDRQQ